ncbi:MAG: ribosome small subunit-dependent GTPase A, partial [Gemmatimonadetes bacterium]|nr:ribosome small subunit-dependent GTPase A [Gemmatimonadota bacterium]NIR80038.1 ribosome small subunit-dependent GTPase A [Gemmatimonadota bacterium]NIT88776.1 ribosome small subunit-dependent GTPase A [Gemmatimonadota bacterium]NIU32580.1 ribosome small subunit-dependent GTPase A [Gemmatimonadota bacterium]NIU37038.1 ribosome small subunit-dependent GTPase A [Gemmatimonadota bacterium]
MLTGTVRRTGGGVYRVALEDGRVVDASIRGRLKRESRTGERVVIGDRVRVEEAPGGIFTVEEVLPRDTQIVRRGPGGRKAKVVAANVGRLVAVAAARRPEPSRRTIDRLLVIGESHDLEALLVINKVDLESATEVVDRLASVYRPIGYRVIPTSAVSGRGVDELAEVLCSGTSALVGPSGVGKSSLLNRVQPGLELRTGELSRDRRRGRHTTVNARLLELECGGLVADTPGFGDIGIWGVDPEGLDRCFPEIRRLLGACRFRGCTHVHEPDCAVRGAV